MLIVYSGTDCSKCDALKAKLKWNGIPYKEINVREDAEALNFLRSKGHRGIPQIYRESGDELIYVGFDI